MSGGALATVLAVAAGLAGSVQIAVMSRLGERIGVLQALGFSTLLTAVLAFVILILARRSTSGYTQALHQPWWVLSGGVLSLLIVFTITYAGPPMRRSQWSSTATTNARSAGERPAMCTACSTPAPA